MKTTLSIISILALAGSLSYAEGDRKRPGKRPNPAEIIKKLDTDGNGSISKAEFMASERAQKDPERAAKAFTHMDSDGDGEISTNDLAQRRRGPGGPGGGDRPNPAEIFKKLDKDGSGSISKEEFLSGERAQNNPEMAGKLFDKLDADSSGDISREEFAKRPNPGDRRGRGDGPKPGNRGEKPGGDNGPVIE